MIVICLGVAGTLVETQRGAAFDTGHHFDLTRSVLIEHGFSPHATQVVQVQNWLVDYYSQSPTAPPALKAELEKLHFDNLFNSKHAAVCWSHLLQNIKNATEQAARDGDALGMLTTIGAAFHAVQDFYSHSNWVETHRPNPGTYATGTWNALGPPQNFSLTTGKVPHPPYPPTPAPPGTPDHGGYTQGLNKDSQIRPGWDHAYVYAYCACHELLDGMRMWSDAAQPGFWQQTQQLALNGPVLQALQRDADAAFRFSLWIKGKGADGHWKGNGSGDRPRFGPYAARWIATPDSPFVQLIKQRQLPLRLTGNLYGVAPAQPLPLPRFQRRRVAVIVRVLGIQETDDVGTFERRIDPGGQADFYARITIGNVTYNERVLQDQAQATNPWYAIHFVDPAVQQVPITIDVWDEDPDGDDRCDINPAPGRPELNFTMRLSDRQVIGDLQGRFDSPATPFQTSGQKPDKDRALLRGYATAIPLAP